MPLTITKKTTKAQLIAHIEEQDAALAEEKAAGAKHVARLQGEITTITETRDKLAQHGTALIAKVAATEQELGIIKRLILDGVRGNA